MTILQMIRTHAKQAEKNSIEKQELVLYHLNNIGYITQRMWNKFYSHLYNKKINLYNIIGDLKQKGIIINSPSKFHGKGKKVVRYKIAKNEYWDIINRPMINRNRSNSGQRI